MEELEEKIILSTCKACETKEEGSDNKWYYPYECEECGHRQFEYVTRKPKLCYPCAKKLGKCFICEKKCNGNK